MLWNSPISFIFLAEDQIYTWKSNTHQTGSWGIQFSLQGTDLLEPFSQWNNSWDHVWQRKQWSGWGVGWGPLDRCLSNPLTWKPQLGSFSLTGTMTSPTRRLPISFLNEKDTESQFPLFVMGYTGIAPYDLCIEPYCRFASSNNKKSVGVFFFSL